MTWQTPAGHAAQFRYRELTNDWNVISSVTTGNEYDLPIGLSGWAIDVGAHIGAVTVALALDNPKLHVIAVEPIPDNLFLLAQHIEANGLADRVVVIDGAAGTDGRVVYGGEGESAEHHAFVGNNEWSLAAPGASSLTAQCWSLSAILHRHKVREVAFLKIDCEGCEWSFLADPAIAKVQRIHGEWHPPGTFAQLGGLLPAHDVQAVGEHGFTAVRRA